MYIELDDPSQREFFWNNLRGEYGFTVNEAHGIWMIRWPCWWMAAGIAAWPVTQLLPLLLRHRVVAS
jgi:hypothetical protein